MIVFVHGVPETAALWDELRRHIDRDSIALSLPGFGISRPPGFTSTMDEYAEWLRAQLDAVGEPVDLVGHDWGTLLTIRMVTAFPDGIRSWFVDNARTFHPDYEWHAFAQTWQTPGEGEQYFASQLARPLEEQARGYEALGLQPEDARALASWADPEMAASILALYRSATPNVHHHWGEVVVPPAAPGMVLHPAADPFGHEAMSRDMAAALGARFDVLPDAGHFWPMQLPEAGAAVLRKFWDSLAP